jgi:hypothetical protein
MIYIAGYYNVSNLGDEAFKETFRIMFDPNSLKDCLKDYPIISNIIKKYYPNNDEITFVNIEDISNPEFILKQGDHLLLGGGDIINDYFISHIRKCMDNFPKVSVGMISVGIVYLVDIYRYTDIMSKMDFVFLRSLNDFEYCSKHIQDVNWGYTPDITNILCLRQQTPELKHQFKKGSIGINVCQTIVQLKDDNKTYRHIINTIIDLIEELKDDTFILLPFDTSGKYIQDDTFILVAIYNGCSPEAKTRVDTTLCIDLELARCINSMLFIMRNYLKAAIVMRFHGHLFAEYSKIPFVSLCLTRKVYNLMLELDHSTIELKNITWKKLMDEIRSITLQLQFEQNENLSE